MPQDMILMRKEIESFQKYLNNIVPMDDETFNKALDYLQVEKISKNEFLIKEGQVCKKVAFVYKGLFRVFNNKDGVEVNTCFCPENSMASSLNSVINQAPSSESIQAIEDSIIISISLEICIQLSINSIQWQRVRQFFTEKECIRLSERANSLSFETALEKYKNIINNQPYLVQRVPIQHLASYIGVSRETLSRIRSKIS